MTDAIVVLSALLIAEFVFAPINLWTGHTLPNFARFTTLAICCLDLMRLMHPARRDPAGSAGFSTFAALALALLLIQATN